MDQRITVLPEADDMLRRLRGVYNDPHMIEKFVPQVQKMAGQIKTASGIVLGLYLAITDYCQGLPPFMETLMSSQMGDFIRALVDDEVVREEALNFLKEVQERAMQ